MKKLFTQLKYINMDQFKFSSMEFLFWATIAANSFNVVFLRERGLKNITIGTVMLMVSIADISSKPLWGIISDKIRSVKKVYICCFAASSIFFILLPLTKNVWLTGLTLLFFGLFSSPLSPLLDTWVVHGVSSSKKVTYGSIRLWGSIGYAVMTFTYGKLIHRTSINIIFPAFFIMAILTMLFSVGVKSVETTYQSPQNEVKISNLFKNYYYVTFILFILFLNIPNTASNTFLPNLVDKVGGNKDLLGMMFSIRALCEIPIFFYSGYLIRKLGPIKLTIISATLYIVQQLVYLISTKPWHVFIGHIIGGPAYSFFLLGMIHYIYLLAPRELKATSQTVANCFSMGLSSMAGNYLGGLLIDDLGLDWLYKIGFINNMLALALFI